MICQFSLAGATSCRGRGQAVAVAAGSDCVTVVTSRAYLLRYVFSQGSNPGGLRLCGMFRDATGGVVTDIIMQNLHACIWCCTDLEVQLSKAAGATVRHVFMDSTGAHTFIVLASGGTLETQYLHAKYECSLHQSYCTILAVCRQDEQEAHGAHAVLLSDMHSLQLAEATVALQAAGAASQRGCL
jgi:hypothetical protein